MATPDPRRFAVEPGSPLHLRGSALIRLFSILGAALMVGLAMQLSERYAMPWLLYLMLPAAVTLLAWSLANQVMAVGEVIQVRTLTHVRTIDLSTVDRIVAYQLVESFGRRRPIAALIGREGRPTQEFVNTMLSGEDFSRLMQWTGRPVQTLPSGMSLQERADSHPELVPAQEAARQASFIWMLINLVIAAAMVVAFWLVARWRF